MLGTAGVQDRFITGRHRAPSPRTAELMKDELMAPALPDCSTTEQEEQRES